MYHLEFTLKLLSLDSVVRYQNTKTNKIMIQY